MNCKPGDLAVIVRARLAPPLLGRLVKCIAPRDDDAWWVDIPLTCPVTGETWFSVYDRALRPIRDQDGEDEILRIAGKPQEVTV
jgi:hypothetical protein